MSNSNRLLGLRGKGKDPQRITDWSLWLGDVLWRVLPQGLTREQARRERDRQEAEIRADPRCLPGTHLAIPRG